jgi:hypothetical protein
LQARSSLIPQPLAVFAGSTDTSLWTHYAAGERHYCGNAFPDGMRKNDRLAANVLTPTTKAADHDVPITAAEIVDGGLMSQADWDGVRGLHGPEQSDCISACVFVAMLGLQHLTLTLSRVPSYLTAH